MIILCTRHLVIPEASSLQTCKFNRQQFDCKTATRPVFCSMAPYDISYEHVTGGTGQSQDTHTAGMLQRGLLMVPFAELTKLT